MKIHALSAPLRLLPIALATILSLPAAISERPSRDLKEDVVDVPAIGEGLSLSNAFQSHMVIQRDKPLKIWGWADVPGEGVTVSFAGQKAVAKAGKDRAWTVTLEPIPANATPQKLTVSAKSTELVLEDILVGDVWVLGGQSNMEFPITKVNDGQFEIASANFPEIRLLTMPGGKGFDSVHSFERLWEYSSWSSRHFRKGDWEACTPETVPEFSAIGYVFGRRLAMATGVPIGLIDTSQGGTTVEAWTPEEVLKGMKGEETVAMMATWTQKIADWDPKADLEKRVANYENNIEKMKERGTPKPTDLRPGPVADKNRPGARYASTIKPLKGLAVAGALFHQGFNNCFGGSEGARMYAQVFPEMVTAWRATFDDPALPFGIISLCTAGEPQTEENFLEPMYDVGAELRAAQYQTFVDFRKGGDETIGFISSFDQRKSWYHPQIKVPVGERAAKWAMATRYELFGGNGDSHWLPPSIEKVEKVDGTLRLTFSTNIAMPDDSSKKMVGFAIAGEDRNYHLAEISHYTDGRKDNRNRPIYDKKVLVLSSPMVPEPAHYRHAWARNPLSNLVSEQRIPVATQRSDDWHVEQVPKTMEQPEDWDDQRFRRWVSGQQKNELRFNDTARRIREAEATVEALKGPFLEEKKKREEAE